MFRRLKNKLFAMRRLTAHQRRLFWRAWLGLLLVDLGLRLVQFPVLQRKLAVATVPDAPHAQDSAATIIVTHKMLSLAARNHVYPMTCLRRALVFQRLLAEQGIVAELCLGVRKLDDVLQAHAWLEYQGQIIGESDSGSWGYRRLNASAWPTETLL